MKTAFDVVSAQCRGSGDLKTFSVGDELAGTSAKGQGYAQVGCNECGTKFTAKILRSSGGIKYDPAMVRVPVHAQGPAKKSIEVGSKVRRPGGSMVAEVLSIDGNYATIRFEGTGTEVVSSLDNLVLA